MPYLFVTATFLGASLLFSVQPILARTVLPEFGGGPAVWNTCMVFFQVMLLAGYPYTHAAIAGLGARRQAILHLAVLALPVAFLPMAVAPRRAPAARRFACWGG